MPQKTAGPDCSGPAARSLSAVAAAVRRCGRPDAADWTRRLRQAALLDEKGEALDGALKTVRSFAIN